RRVARYRVRKRPAKFPLLHTARVKCTDTFDEASPSRLGPAGCSSFWRSASVRRYGAAIRRCRSRQLAGPGALAKKATAPLRSTAELTGTVRQWAVSLLTAPPFRAGAGG